MAVAWRRSTWKCAVCLRKWKGRGISSMAEQMKMERGVGPRDVRRGYDPLLCTEVMFSDEEDFYTARLFKVNTYTNADLGKR